MYIFLIYLYLPLVLALIWLGYKLYGFAIKKNQPKVSYSISNVSEDISFLKRFVGLVWVIPGLCIIGVYFYMYLITPSKQFSPFELKGSVIEQAVQYVNEFQKFNKRLPSEGDFSSWEREILKLGENEVGLSYLIPPYPSEVLIKFGEPPKNSFLIGYWAGDVYKYYVPWLRESNVLYVFDEEYFMMGSAFKDFLLFLAYASIFIIPSFCLVASSLASKSKKCLS